MLRNKSHQSESGRLSSENPSSQSTLLLEHDSGHTQEAASENQKTLDRFDTLDTIPTRTRSSSARWWFNGVALLSFCVPCVTVLICFYFYNATRPFDTFSGQVIGGNFSQSQAKAIDIVVGGLLAPIFMTGVNFVWFGSARVSVVNEKQAKAIPIRSLVAVSSTCSGNYDLFNLRDLLHGRTWRLFFFGLLTILSAVARTSLTNLIAYEAYALDKPLGNSNRLRLQRDMAIEKTFQGPYGSLIPWGSMMSTYQFDQSQQSDVTEQISSLLTGLSFQNASSKLIQGMYVGVNATEKSLSALNQSVITLNDVPAYRLSVDCKPAIPIDVSMASMGQYSVHLQLSLDVQLPNGSYAPGWFTWDYPGKPETISSGDSSIYTFVAFQTGSLEAYLGRLERFDMTNHTLPSSYGDVGYGAYDLSAFQFHVNPMSVSGLQCALFREEGFVSLYRGSSLNASDWKFQQNSSSPFFVDEKKNKTRVPSMLVNWQSTDLNFHAPQSTYPGFGPALTGSAMLDDQYTWGHISSFSDFALNYLYASGEVQRITYEVAASTTNTSQSPAEFFVDVSGTTTEQRYRMTFVPSVLLVGLLCLFLAGTITLAMAFYAWKTLSAKAFRQVNTLRLLVDSVAGLRDDAKEMARLGAASNETLDDWAAKYKVKYSEFEKDGKTVRIVLEKR